MRVWDVCLGTKFESPLLVGVAIAWLATFLGPGCTPYLSLLHTTGL
jgi:hypothetical protein